MPKKNPITPARVAELLAAARAKAAADGNSIVAAAVATVQTEHKNGTEVDLSNLGVTAENIQHPETVELVTNVIEAAYAPPVPEVPVPIADEPIITTIAEDVKKVLGVARDDITYNDKQQQFIDMGLEGKDLVLIGAAGTGKTTTQRGFSKRLIAEGKIPLLGRSTKYLKADVHGVAVCSFTNKAVNNIRHALPHEIKPHALTIHKLLEFAPVFYEIADEENPGQMKKTMRFEPNRNKYNPLPSTLKLIIFEESSMIGYTLHDQLLDACPHKPQLIYLGDIQQLPPIFDSAILGFKMLELPVVELTEVYRQARNSPIIDLAWKLLEGDAKVFRSVTATEKATITDRKTGKPKEIQRIYVPALRELSRKNDDGEVIFQPWQKRLSAEMGLNTAVMQFNSWADMGYYNPDDDIILCPFNVNFGTVELNKGIMQHLGRKRGAEVHEIVAGFNKHYLAEGDRVLYQKEDAIIKRIVSNGEYMGKSYQRPSVFLDRWGYLREEDMDADALDAHTKIQEEETANFDLEAIDKFLEAAASDSDERVTSASHLIDLYIPATAEVVTLETASEVNSLLGGYAITVHKSQGSEWDSVFLVMQHTHATMNQRELLYTAVTRAKRRLHIICEPDTFEKGIKSQKIKGNTLAEKAEEFKGKVQERERKLLEEKKITDQQQDALTLAFSLVPEWDTLARDSVSHWWRVAQQWWKAELANKPVPTFGWQIKGSAAGFAKMGTNEVYASPVYLFIDPNDMISDTIPHEVAHIVAYKVFGDKGHGFGWKKVMEKFGRNPVESRYHNLGKLPDALKKIMEESSNAQKGKVDDESAE